MASKLISWHRNYYASERKLKSKSDSSKVGVFSEELSENELIHIYSPDLEMELYTLEEFQMLLYQLYHSLPWTNQLAANRLYPNLLLKTI